MREPNEVSEARNLNVGDRVRIGSHSEGEIVGWDKDGDPVIELDDETFGNYLASMVERIGP